MRPPLAHSLDLPRVNLGVLLALALMFAGAVIWQGGPLPRPEGEPEQTQQIPDLPTWIIPPDRQEAVDELVAPIARAPLGDQTVSSVSVERSLIRLRVEPSGESLVIEPSTDEDASSLQVRWEGEHPPPDLEALRSMLRRRYRGGIWISIREPREDPSPRTHTEPEPSPGPWSGRYGMLTPALVYTDLPQRPFLLLTLLLPMTLALLLGWRRREGKRTVAPERLPPLTASRWLAAAIAIGVLVRVWLSAVQPLENDEVYGYFGVLGDDHDTWVHPPLYRSLHLAWSDLCGWTGGGSPLLRRVPTLAASLTGLLLFGAAQRRSRGRGALPAVLLIATAPFFVIDTLKARPYAIAALLAVVFALSLWPGEEREESTTSLRHLNASLAVGLAAFTDLPTAGFLWLAFFLHCAARIREDRREARALLPWLGLAALFALPFLPGGLQAIANPVLPHHGAGIVISSQPGLFPRLEEQGLLRALSEAAGFMAVGWSHHPLSLIGIPLLAFGLWIGLRRGPRDLALACLLGFLFAMLWSLRHPIRPRNVLFNLVLWATLLAQLRQKKAPGSSPPESLAKDDSASSSAKSPTAEQNSVET